MSRRHLSSAVPLLVLLLALGARPSFAQEAQPKAPAPEPSPVRVGKTTVPVIDENESVDDVVSRVRAARAREPGARRTPEGRLPERTGPASPDVRRKIRDARVGDRGRPGPALRERIRERLSERKPLRPRAEQKLRRQRNR
jgi:hypothetical protein